MTLPEVYNDFEKLKGIQEKFNRVTAQLEEANKNWEEVATAIDKFED